MKSRHTIVERGSTALLRLTILCIGIVVLALCVFALPAGILSDETGYYKPILAGLYVPAVPFFYALYQAIKLLDLIDKNKAFTLGAVRALKNIKKSAFLISALFTAGLPYIYYAAQRDDAPGVMALGCVIVGASFVIGTTAALFQRLFQSALDIKSENELTV